MATEIKERNGAGYIYFNKLYHVLACYYSKEKDAQTIASNLKSEYPNTEVYCISHFKPQSNFHNSTLNIYNTTLTIISYLEKSTIELEQKILNITSFKNNLSTLQEKFINVKNNFIDFYQNNH